jgi:hypothetical protein
MDLMTALGPEHGLFEFPADEIREMLGLLRVKDSQLENLVLANYAELGVFSAGMTGTLTWPLRLPSSDLPLIMYKTNTITYTCGYHRGVFEPRSEYAFLFSSDCWKLREILDGEPLVHLLKDPMAVRQRMIKSQWHLVLPGHDEQGVIRDVLLLLWYTKAHLIGTPMVGSQGKERLVEVVAQLREALDLRDRLRGTLAS